MISRREFMAVFLLIFGATAGSAAECDAMSPTGGLGTNWRQGVTGLEYLDRAAFSCPRATITAIRFDRRRFVFTLLDTHEEKRFIDQKLNRGGVFLDARRQLFRFGSNIATLANLGRLAGDLVAATPASWWLDTEPIEPDGYLKIGGAVKNEAFGLQSSLICVDDEGGQSNASLFYFQKRGVFSYANWPKAKRDKFNACRNVLQTAPRLVEIAAEREQYLTDGANASNPRINCLREEHPQAGFCRAANPAVAARQRVILIADNKERYYLAYFHDELSFYDIQRILLSNSFYSDSSPMWAVNLAGGERAGIYLKFGTSRLEYGNLEADLPSVLAIRKR